MHLKTSGLTLLFEKYCRTKFYIFFCLTTNSLVHQRKALAWKFDTKTNQLKSFVGESTTGNIRPMFVQSVESENVYNTKKYSPFVVLINYIFLLFLIS